MFYELQHLIHVVEEGTFTGAARAAHLSQPAMSASIQRLEDDLGAQLFERGRRGARLTAAGRALLPHARAALAAIDDGRRAVAQVLDLSRGEVRLGSGATVATYLLPPQLTSFRERLPGIVLTLREMHASALCDAVEEGRLDLAIVDAAAVGKRRLAVQPWRDDELVVVGLPGARIEDPFVTFVAGSTTRALLDRHVPDAQIVVELSGIAAIKRHVRAGAGITLLTRSAVAEDLAAGTMVALDHPAAPIPRPLVLAHRPHLSPAAEALVEHLRP